MTVFERSLHLLVAEDNAINRALTRAILEQAGHRGSFVTTGKQVLETLERERFDLVLMDVQMPEMDGFEATRRLRASEQTRGVRLPVVALTARDTAGDRARCLAAGMDAHLLKPLDVRELLRVLHALCLGSQLEPARRRVQARHTFDRARLLDMLGRDAQLAREIIELYLHDAPTLIGQLSSDVEHREFAAVASRAHQLRGVLGNLAAAAATTLTSGLEQAADRMDGADLTLRFEVLRSELGRLELALRDELSLG